MKGSSDKNFGDFFYCYLILIYYIVNRFENVDGFDRLQPRKKIAKDNTIYAEALLHKSKIHLRVSCCKMYFIFYSRKWLIYSLQNQFLPDIQTK